MKKLKIGIPKGSLESATIELFRKSGWKISLTSRNYFPIIDDETLSCTLIRAQEMSRYVEDGTLDLGLTGKDWIMENGSEVEVIDDLIYSKVSQKPARWVLAVKDSSSIKKLEDLQGRKIATELVNFTRDYFAKRNIKVDVELLSAPYQGTVAPVLVTGIGNPSRGNDAIGPLAIERLETMALPGVELLTDFQLQVEHALDLVGREEVVFVDATVAGDAPFTFAPVAPVRDASATTHALSPAAVLDAYLRVTDERLPPAQVLAIRGYAFTLGEGLSKGAAANLEAAVRALVVALAAPASAAALP